MATTIDDEGSVIHSGWSTAKVAGEWELDVLGVPFGGPIKGKDAHGEFFTAKSALMLKVGDQRPVFYNHGHDPANRKEDFPSPIGTAEYVGVRPDGHWFRVRLDRASDYAKAIMDAARKGIARASGGTISYLRRVVEWTGEILFWPLAELTLIDTVPGKREPANDYAVVQLRSAYKTLSIEIPDVFTADAADATEALIDRILEEVRDDRAQN